MHAALDLAAETALRLPWEAPAALRLSDDTPPHSMGMWLRKP
jgi:hypothetical protein